MSDWIRQEWQQFTPAASTPEIARDGTPAPIDPHRPCVSHWPLTDSIGHTGVMVELNRHAT